MSRMKMKTLQGTELQLSVQHAKVLLLRQLGWKSTHYTYFTHYACVITIRKAISVKCTNINIVQ